MLFQLIKLRLSSYTPKMIHYPCGLGIKMIHYPCGLGIKMIHYPCGLGIRSQTIFSIVRVVRGD